MSNINILKDSRKLVFLRLFTIVVCLLILPFIRVSAAEAEVTETAEVMLATAVEAETELTVYMPDETPFFVERVVANILTAQSIQPSIIRQDYDSVLFKSGGAVGTTGSENTVVIGIEDSDNGNLKKSDFDIEGYHFYSEDSDLLETMETGLKLIKDSQIYDNIISGKSVNSQTDTKVVFALGSYSPEMEWESKFSSSLKSSLEETGLDYSLYLYEMGFRRVNNVDIQYQVTEDYIRSRFISEYPDVIIAGDNDALTFINKYYKKYFEGVPVVFCGINFFDSTLVSNLGDNFTGIEESTSPYKTIDLALKINPSYDKIYLICDDTASAKRIKEYALEKISELYGDKMPIITNKNEPLSDTIEDINSYGANTLVILSTYYIDSTGHFFKEEDFLKYFEGKLTVPIWIKMSSFIGGGTATVGGVVSDSETYAKAAVEMAVRILNGTHPSLIPVISENESENLYDKVMFDHNALNYFNISKDLLPKKATIINEPPNMFANDPRLVTGFVVALVSLAVIFVLSWIFIHMLRKRNRALIAAQENLVEIDKLYELQKVASDRQEFTKHILETAPFPFAMNLDGRIVTSNNAMKEKFSIVNEDDDLAEFYKSPLQLQEINKRALKGETVMNYPAVMLTNEGERHCLISAATVNYNSHQSVIHWISDINELEERAVKLKLMNQLMRELICVLPVPLVIFRKSDMKIMLLNDALKVLEEHYNFSLTKGDNHRAIVAKYLEERKAMGLSNTVNNFDVNFIWELTPEQGEHFIGNIICGEAMFEGEQAIIFTGVDITAQSKQEQLLKDAAQKEKAANELKSLFVANMSHEMRTPLNAIIGMSTIAMSTKDNDKVMNCISKIFDASQHLLGEINDILDMSKIEAGKMELITEEFEFVKACEQVVEMITFRANEKQLKLETHLDPDIPGVLIGDGQKLSQVITNLMNNAVKFTPENGSITLSGKVLSEKDGIFEVEMSVKDTGIGITKDQLAKLFKPFTQADATTSRNFGGTGLGLTISKSIVELMDGKIYCNSEFGKGSEFVFTFKMPKGTQSVQKDDIQNNFDFTGKNILIVEDVDMNREVIAALLEDTNVIMDFAENGVAAVKKFKDNHEKYSLIFMDVHMPLMDGYEATENIRNSNAPNAKTIPIIAMTANVFKEDIQKCLTAGMNNHVGKPIDIQQVKEIMKKYI